MSSTVFLLRTDPFLSIFLKNMKSIGIVTLAEEAILHEFYLFFLLSNLSPKKKYQKFARLSEISIRIKREDAKIC